METTRDFLLCLRDSPGALPRVVLRVHQRGVRVEGLAYRVESDDRASLRLRVTGQESRLEGLGRRLADVVEVLDLRDDTPS